MRNDGAVGGTRTKCAVAILAGGRGSRLGGLCKPLVLVAGRTILARQLAVLGTRFDDIVLVTNEPALFAAYGLPSVPDLRPGLGPLAGLEAALAATSAHEVFVVAGDLPSLDARAIALVMDAPPADVAAIYGRHGPEPLHARYARSVLPTVRAALDEKRLAVHEFYRLVSVSRIEEAEVRAFDPALLCLANVNTPEDLARLNEQLGH